MSHSQHSPLYPNARELQYEVKEANSPPYGRLARELASGEIFPALPSDKPSPAPEVWDL